MLRAGARKLASMAAWPSAVVQPGFVQANLPALTLLDASWYLPAAGAPARDGKAEFLERRVPSARHFDINKPGLCDASSGLPHMLPTPREFAPEAAALGLTHARGVVVYDGAGLFSAARVWLTLKALGHPCVAVLEGGLPRWIAEGRPIEEGPPPPAEPVAQEQWTLDASLVRSLDEVLAAASQRQALEGNKPRLRDTELLVDARPAARFLGTAPEPRAGLRCGHAPHSRSVPSGSLLDAAHHNALLPRAQLEAVFKAAGVDVRRPGTIVASCGSGVTACIVALALVECGRPLEGIALFDGSWADYGRPRDDAPVVAGPALPDAE